MLEVVRFYWHRGELSLPLNVILKEDQHPLRLRHSVVQAHAPEVARQLEDGRFVVAAWKSDGIISMILCHPNVAKGNFDTLLINTPALPKVVLKLNSWQDGPNVSRLLLRAFGSESQSIEECSEARKELVNWLTDQGQSQMAAIVKKFQTFPFSLRSDELEHLLILGQKEQIDRFIGEVEQRFEAIGWTATTAYESQLHRNPQQLNRSYYWISGPGNSPHILLHMNRETERSIRGVTYNIHDLRPGIPDFASEIQRVITEVLEPSAAAVGLEISYTHLGPFSRCGIGTKAAMIALAEAGNGQWPLPPALQPLWRKFIITALREDAALHRYELTKWFIANGWNQEDSRALTNRFYADATLLAEFKNEEQVA